VMVAFVAEQLAVAPRPGRRKWEGTGGNPSQIYADRPGEGQALRGRPVYVQLNGLAKTWLK
jgi:hypothetical protein